MHLYSDFLGTQSPLNIFIFNIIYTVKYEMLFDIWLLYSISVPKN